MGDYHSGSHSKWLLKVHVILAVKYRKKLLDFLGPEVKELCLKCSGTINSGFSIEVMEVDRDHIHLLVDFQPKTSVKEIVRKLKSYTSVFLWKSFAPVLEKEFWKKHMFWSDGYFACTTGSASTETIRHYIETQG